VQPEDPPLVAFDPWSAPLEGITLIEASAGTGKTYNIAEIYVRLLLRLAHVRDSATSSS
jgi:exodeoxyribonuclease V beta subunit